MVAAAVGAPVRSARLPCPRRSPAARSPTVAERATAAVAARGTVVVAAGRTRRASTTASTAVHDRHDIAATVGVSVGRVPVTSTCESCGAADDELYAVHRQYVTPAEWDTPGREVTLDEVERWCFSCCTHYPHVLVEP